MRSIFVLRSWKVVLLKDKRPTDQKEIVVNPLHLPCIFH